MRVLHEMIDLRIDAHPSLRFAAFTTELPVPLAQLPSPTWLTVLLRNGARAPVQRTETLRTAVRDMLRYGGYKPTGRGKPASEYLVRTAEEGGIRSINLAVDACNVVSLHSGFPISVVDMDLAEQPFRIAIAAAATSYVFNPTGQEIDVSGLVCLHDAQGPCGNAVKDSQRTKTHDETSRTLSVIWGAKGFEQELEAAYAWYVELLQDAGAKVLRIAY
jgi:DNA/RNA-binding domain of Phe-tRNA-synthetase-like protein